jgi:hypothetical protein
LAKSASERVAGPRTRIEPNRVWRTGAFVEDCNDPAASSVPQLSARNAPDAACLTD